MSKTQNHLPFRTAAVLGAGVMGSQIAAHLANAGLTVHLLDIPGPDGNKNAVVEGAFKMIQKLKPAPFVSAEAAKRITLGNFEEHFDRVAQAEWVIEVIIEKLDIKQQLMARIEETANENAVISTNTSGLPISQIAQGRSDAFTRRFLGTHFFNPPRYLQLLEIIPTEETDDEILERVQWFGRVHLGKSIVIAKDTPNFIANRIGNYASMQVIRFLTDGDYTIEEIDTLTGPMIGHAKSATFRTADVVGLDTALYVADNLYQAIPDDESREGHKAPELLRKLVGQKRLGAKTRQGFYKKIGKNILSLNLDTFEYEPPKPMSLGDLKPVWKAGGAKARLNALYADEGRAGAFTRATMLDLIGYCARRVPEIADRPVDIDRGIAWGFAWQFGPFEAWDALGFERVFTDMEKANVRVPDWVHDMKARGFSAFYRENETGQQEVYVPGSGYVVDLPSADELTTAMIVKKDSNTIWKNEDAALLDMGDGVAQFDLRSKANTLTASTTQSMYEAIDFVENNDFRGMVLGNDGGNFSLGANLGEMAFAVMEKKFDLIGQSIANTQNMMQRIRYARKPIVTAVQGMALGGGCEFTMASAQTIAALESYVGLVELGVGIIPGACGTVHMTAQASARAASDRPNEIQPFLLNAVQTVATARVSASAHEAIELGLLKPNTRVVMNAKRRLSVAKQTVVHLSESGYLPPPVRTSIMVLGKPGSAALQSGFYQFQLGGYASEYDRFLAGKLAYVMTGGELTGPAAVHEDYLIDLERETFLSLLGEEKTLERIEHMIKTNKPLRN